MSYFQQGDVLLKQINEVPGDATVTSSDLVHQGQNHSHRVTGEAQIWLHGNDMFLTAGKDCAIIHAEHNAISIPPGGYKKEIVLEYDHFLEESRQVVD